MSKNRVISVCVAICLVAALAPVVAQAQTCEPLDNGRLAIPRYEGTLLLFEPIVEFREMVLTITGPCEDIVRVFGPKDTIAFDIREIERVTDGQYSWELRRVASIDPGVQEDLQAARGTGEEDALWWSYFQKGAIPEGPYVDSGAFSVVKGLIVDPTGVEERRASVSSKAGAALAGASLAGESSQDLSSRGAGDNSLATKDVVFNDDLIVIGSSCVGFDCVNGEVFGFDTIRLKENNLRIQFNDTSGSSFPTTNWQIRANSSQSGGENFLGFMDQGANGESENGTRVFAVEAGAGSNALFVESGGDAGFGTGNPVLNLHVVDGDSPGLRLEQDASSGFQAQTWDIAGNETNFFVRDVTSGSLLPFRIFPGSSSSSLVIRNSNVGVGTTSPGSRLHVFTSGGGVQTLFELEATGTNGRPRFTFSNPDGAWFYEADGTNFAINRSGSGGAEELLLEPNGDLTIGGMLTELSSRSAKEGFVELDPQDVLERVVELPVLSWTYTADAERARHIGPMAEDFYRAFELGDDDQHIAPSDKVGVALLAIQGLQRELAKRDSRIEELGTEKAALEERLSNLERLVEQLATE